MAIIGRLWAVVWERLEDGLALRTKNFLLDLLGFSSRKKPPRGWWRRTNLLWMDRTNGRAGDGVYNADQFGGAVSEMSDRFRVRVSKPR